MKPDAKLTRNLERAERFGVIAGYAHGLRVAGDAELVKEIADFARNDAFEFEAAEKIGLLFLGRCQQAGLSRPSVEPALRRTDEA